MNQNIDNTVQSIDEILVAALQRSNHPKAAVYASLIPGLFQIGEQVHGHPNAENILATLAGMAKAFKL